MKIKEGQTTPFLYGYAWHNYDSRTNEAYLMPFNIILRYLRNVYLYLGGYKEDYEARAFRKGFSEGERLTKTHLGWETNKIREELAELRGLLKK